MLTNWVHQNTHRCVRQWKRHDKYPYRVSDSKSSIYHQIKCNGILNYVNMRQFQLVSRQHSWNQVIQGIGWWKVHVMMCCSAVSAGMRNPVGQPPIAYISRSWNEQPVNKNEESCSKLETIHSWYQARKNEQLTVDAENLSLLPSTDYVISCWTLQSR